MCSVPSFARIISTGTMSNWDMKWYSIVFCEPSVRSRASKTYPYLWKTGAPVSLRTYVVTLSFLYAGTGIIDRTDVLNLLEPFFTATS